MLDLYQMGIQILMLFNTGVDVDTDGSNSCIMLIERDWVETLMPSNNCQMAYHVWELWHFVDKICYKSYNI